MTTPLRPNDLASYTRSRSARERATAKVLAELRGLGLSPNDVTPESLAAAIDADTQTLEAHAAKFETQLAPSLSEQSAHERSGLAPATYRLSLEGPGAAADSSVGSGSVLEALRAAGTGVREGATGLARTAAKALVGTAFPRSGLAAEAGQEALSGLTAPFVLAEDMLQHRADVTPQNVFNATAGIGMAAGSLPNPFKPRLPAGPTPELVRAGPLMAEAMAPHPALTGAEGLPFERTQAAALSVPRQLPPQPLDLTSLLREARARIPSHGTEALPPGFVPTQPLPSVAEPHPLSADVLEPRSIVPPEELRLAAQPEEGLVPPQVGASPEFLRLMGPRPVGPEPPISTAELLAQARGGEAPPVIPTLREGSVATPTAGGRGIDITGSSPQPPVRPERSVFARPEEEAFRNAVEQERAAALRDLLAKARLPAPVEPSGRLLTKKAAPPESTGPTPEELAESTSLVDESALGGDIPYSDLGFEEPLTRADAVEQFREAVHDPDAPPLPKAMKRRAKALEQEVASGSLSPEEAVRRLHATPDEMIERGLGKRARAQKKSPAALTEQAAISERLRQQRVIEQNLEDEGLWQRLMRAPREEKASIAAEMTPEQAGRALTRLKAAPGFDHAAQQALEARTHSAASFLPPGVSPDVAAMVQQGLLEHAERLGASGGPNPYAASTDLHAAFEKGKATLPPPSPGSLGSEVGAIGPLGREPRLETTAGRVVERQPASQPVGTLPDVLNPASVDPESMFNLARMQPNTPEFEATLRDLVQRAAAGRGPRGIQHLSQALADAKALSTNVGALLRVDPRRLSGVERTALRLNAAAGIERIGELQTRVESLPQGSADRVALEGELDRQLAFNQEVIQHAMEAGTAQGRDLAFNRIMAAHTLDPLRWIARAKQVRGLEPLTDEHIATIQRLASQKNALGLAEYVNSLRYHTPVEKAVALYKTGLISALTTAAKVVASNVTTLPARAVSGTLLRPLFDRALGAYSGLATHTRLGASLLDVAERAARGTVRDVHDLARGKPTLVGPGGPVGAQAGAFGIREPTFETPIAGDIANFYIRVIGRREGILHRFGWQPAYQAALFEQARLLARDAGATDLTAAARTLADNPTPEMQVRAIEAANNATLLRENVLSKMVGVASEKALRYGAAGKAGYLALQTSIPFARIGTNIVEMGLGHLPSIAADLAEFFKAEKGSAAQGRIQSRLSRNMAYGAGVAFPALVAGMELYRRGLFTAAKPASPEEKLQWEAEGRGPNSVKIAGKWRSIIPLGPIGLTLALGANLAHALSDPSLAFGEQVTGALAATAETAGEESFFSALSDLGRVAQGEPGAISGAVRQRVGSLVPGIVAKGAESLDPYVRNPQTALEAVEARLPFLSKNVPPKMSTRGTPLTRPQTGFDRFLNPLRSGPQDRELEGLHLPPEVLQETADAGTLEQRIQKVMQELTAVAEAPDGSFRPGQKERKLAELNTRLERIIAAFQEAEPNARH